VRRKLPEGLAAPGGRPEAELALREELAVWDTSPEP
jgi:hypothetical protein